MTERTRKKKTQTAPGTQRKVQVKARTKVKTAPPDAESLQALQAQIDEKIVQLTESNRQLKRKIFDLYTVFEISRNFNAVLKFQTLLDTFIFTCLGQVGALKGAIFLKRDPSSEKLFLVKAKGSGSFPSANAGFEADSRLLSYLAGINRPVLVTDLIGDACTAEELEVLSDFQSGVAVPLIYQTRLIGLFMLSDKISGRMFQMDDIEFLSILANQIAVAIENARLYESEKLASLQQRNLQQQLLQSEKLAALGEMSAKIAHEVNNPLGIIKNYLLLLRRSSAEGGESAKYVGIVEQEIDRIAGIVRQLLEFHRPKPVSFTRLEVTGIIDDVLNLLDRPLAFNNIELVRKFEADGAEILGSADSLKQVFINLAINARDAMADGGRLTVSVRRKDDDLVVQFCDNGPGIPPDILPRIFDPFFTTKEPGQGTGLGLSVCYGIIKNHNGTIQFRNTNPGGCFEIHLPLTTKGKDRVEID